MHRRGIYIVSIEPSCPPPGALDALPTHCIHRALSQPPHRPHTPVWVSHNSSPRQRAGRRRVSQLAVRSKLFPPARVCSFSSWTRNTSHPRPAQSPKRSKAVGAGNQYCNSTSWSLQQPRLFEMTQDNISHNPDYICFDAIKVEARRQFYCPCSHRKTPLPLWSLTIGACHHALVTSPDMTSLASRSLNITR